MPKSNWSWKPIIALAIIVTSMFALSCMLLAEQNAYTIENMLLLNRNAQSFRFRLKPTKCEETENIFAVLLIYSRVENFQERMMHRVALTEQLLNDLHMKRIFLLATAPNRAYHREVLYEQRHCGDLLQADFTESIFSGMLKPAMGFQWIRDECRKAVFVISTSDNAVFDVFHIRNYLKRELTRQPDILHSTDYYLDNVDSSAITVKAENGSTSKQLTKFFPILELNRFFIANVPTALSLLQTVARFDDLWNGDWMEMSVYIRTKPINDWFTTDVRDILCCCQDVDNYTISCGLYVTFVNDTYRELFEVFVEKMKKCAIMECAERTLEQQRNRTCNLE